MYPVDSRDYCIHIGVGSDVVCSILIGNARASVRGTDNRRFHAFFMSFCQISGRHKRPGMNALPNAVNQDTNREWIIPIAIPEREKSRIGVSVEYAPQIPKFYGS